MARLNFEAFPRALDANGAPASGAKLYVYEAGTTTPVTTYSDEGLTTAHAHPVVADVAGFFPQIYVAEGKYKIKMATAADVTIDEVDDVNQGGDGYATVAALLASNEGTRGTGAIWQGGGHRYEEVTTGEHVTTAGGVKLKVLRGPDGKYNAEAFNVPTDESSDCASAMVSAFEAAMGGTLVIPPRKYVWATGSNTVTLTDDLTVEWQGAEFYNGHSGSITLQFEAEVLATPTMSGSVLRGGTSITVGDASDIPQGSVLGITNSAAWETGYSYKKREAHLVQSASGTTITLARPLLFGHDSAAETVTLAAYAAHKLTLKGGLTCTYPTSAGGTGRVLDFSGLANLEFDGLRLIDPQRRKGSGPDVVFAQYCHGIRGRNVFIDGTRYAINISSGCWDTIIDTVQAQFSWHPIDFNSGASKGVVANIRGYRNEATVNTHPAFEITYDNAFCVEDGGYNHRSIGGALNNITFRSSQTLGTIYIQSVSLVDDVYDEYDARYTDVSITDMTGALIGSLGVTYNPRRLFQTRCAVATMGHGLAGDCERWVTDCETGFLKHRGGEAHIKGLKLVGDGSNTTPLDFQASGEVSISGLSVSGTYDSLFLYTQASTIRISDFLVDGLAVDFASNYGSDDIYLANGKFKNCALPLTGYTQKKVRTENVEMESCTGSILSKNKGQSTGTTDANGNLTIAHGLYDAPTFPSVEIEGDVTYMAQVQASDATNITVRVADLTAGAADKTSTGVTVFWYAEI